MQQQRKPSTSGAFGQPHADQGVTAIRIDGARSSTDMKVTRHSLPVSLQPANPARLRAARLRARFRAFTLAVMPLPSIFAAPVAVAAWTMRSGYS